VHLRAEGGEQCLVEIDRLHWIRGRGGHDRDPRRRAARARPRRRDEGLEHRDPTALPALPGFDPLADPLAIPAELRDFQRRTQGRALGVGHARPRRSRGAAAIFEMRVELFDVEGIPAPTVGESGQPRRDCGGRRRTRGRPQPRIAGARDAIGVEPIPRRLPPAVRDHPARARHEIRADGQRAAGQDRL